MSLWSLSLCCPEHLGKTLRLSFQNRGRQGWATRRLLLRLLVLRQIEIHVLSKAINQALLGLSFRTVGKPLRNFECHTDILREYQLFMILAHLEDCAIVQIEEDGRDEFTHDPDGCSDIRRLGFSQEHHGDADDNNPESDCCGNS